jgi:hypothetical protein
MTMSMSSSTITVASPGLRRVVLVAVALILGMVGSTAVSSGDAHALAMTRRWYGADIELDRRETNLLTAGAAGAAAVSTAIPDPTLSKVVAASAGVLAAYAAWVQGQGGCVKLRVMYWRPHIVPGHYFGGRCR